MLHNGGKKKDSFGGLSIKPLNGFVLQHIKQFDMISDVGRRSRQSALGRVNTPPGAKHSNHQDDKVILRNNAIVIFHIKRLFIGYGMGVLLTC